MEWLVIVALLVIVIVAARVLGLTDADYGSLFPPLPGREHYMDFIGESADSLPNGKADLADFRQGLPLADFLEPAMGLTTTGAASCAADDSERQTELGGQYVQRTNNYRRDYPDHCSSLFSDFVGSVYRPKYGGVGKTVPCDGSC
jgi:hypothetical protein